MSGSSIDCTRSLPSQAGDVLDAALMHTREGSKLCKNQKDSACMQMWIHRKHVKVSKYVIWHGGTLTISLIITISLIMLSHNV